MLNLWIWRNCSANEITNRARQTNTKAERARETTGDHMTGSRTKLSICPAYANIAENFFSLHKKNSHTCASRHNIAYNEASAIFFVRRLANERNAFHFVWFVTIFTKFFRWFFLSRYKKTDERTT